ncbi:MAG: glycosyltransferase [Bacteroidales bacterium]|nr:glycosyltransferase [Bacteroidales bacterium]
MRQNEFGSKKAREMSNMVSICCLVYNHEPFLRECFEGFVMQQTTFPIEILVHDDASTDHSADIIREYTAKYPDLFKPIYQAENQYSKGVDVLSINIKRAQGKYIALCEGDDYWTDPLKLQKQVEFMENDINNEYVLCFHDSTMIDKDGNTIKKNIISHSDISALELMKNKIPPTQTILFRKQCLDDGFLDFSSKAMKAGVISGDSLLCFSLGKNGKGKYVSDISNSVYRIHGDGIWSSQSELSQNILKYNLYTFLQKQQSSTCEYYRFRRKHVAMWLTNETSQNRCLRYLIRFYFVSVLLLVRDYDFYHIWRVTLGVLYNIGHGKS